MGEETCVCMYKCMCVHVCKDNVIDKTRNTNIIMDFHWERETKQTRTGGPVVKTWHFHCRGRGFYFWSGKFHMPQSATCPPTKKKASPQEYENKNTNLTKNCCFHYMSNIIH